MDKNKLGSFLFTHHVGACDLFTKRLSIHPSVRFSERQSRDLAIMTMRRHVSRLPSVRRSNGPSLSAVRDTWWPRAYVNHPGGAKTKRRRDRLSWGDEGSHVGCIHTSYASSNCVGLTTRRFHFIPTLSLARPPPRLRAAPVVRCRLFLLTSCWWRALA